MAHQFENERLLCFHVRTDPPYPCGGLSNKTVNTSHKAARVVYPPVLGNPTSRAYTSFSLIPLLPVAGSPRKSSGPSLRRSITPGRKGSIKMSARSTSCRTTAYPLRVYGFGQSCISEGYWGLRGLERTCLGVYSDRSLASREDVWRGGGVGTRTIDTDNLSTEVGQDHAHHWARRKPRELGRNMRLC